MGRGPNLRLCISVCGPVTFLSDMGVHGRSDASIRCLPTIEYSDVAFRDSSWAAPTAWHFRIDAPSREASKNRCLLVRTDLITYSFALTNTLKAYGGCPSHANSSWQTTSRRSRRKCRASEYHEQRQLLWYIADSHLRYDVTLCAPMPLICLEHC
jgi:hypothetical protein